MFSLLLLILPTAILVMVTYYAIQDLLETRKMQKELDEEFKNE